MTRPERKGSYEGFSISPTGEMVDDWIHQEIEDGLSKEDALEERLNAFRKGIEEVGLTVEESAELYLLPGDKIEPLPIS
jgi:hypothetical protein